MGVLDGDMPDPQLDKETAVSGHDDVQTRHDTSSDSNRNSNSNGEEDIQAAKARPNNDTDDSGSNSGRERDIEKAAAEDPMTKTDSNVSIAETMSLAHEVVFVGLICTAQLCTQSGLAQTLVILHAIGESLNITNDAELSWLIAGYSLTVGTFILFSGRLGDVFGYKRMLLFGFAWFAVWSMVAGLAVFAPGHVLFVVARVFQGIGPAFCLPNALAIFGATYKPGRRKAMVFSLFGAAAPNGALLGACFAAIFEHFAWWPWAFWAFAIGLAGIAVAGYFVIPDPPHKMSLGGDKSSSLFVRLVEGLDLYGTVVGVAALVLFNFAWNQAPIVGWKTAEVLAPLIIGLAMFGVFMYVETRISPYPLIPFHALTGDVPFVLLAMVCGWACFGTWIFYAWQFIIQLRGASPLLSVAYFSPCCIAGLIAAISTGFLLGVVRPAVVMTIALSAFLVGSTLMATVPVDQIYWAQIFVTMCIMPFGMDMSFPASTIILSDAVKSKKEQGIAASLINTVVNYSISIGVAISATVEVHVNDGGKTLEDLERGYRAGLWVAVGFAATGLIICIAFCFVTFRRREKNGVDSDKDGVNTGSE